MKSNSIQVPTNKVDYIFGRRWRKSQKHSFIGRINIKKCIFLLNYIRLTQFALKFDYTQRLSQRKTT